MTISNLNQVISGMQPLVPYYKSWVATVAGGHPVTTWYSGGFGSAGVADTTLNGVARSSTSGLVPGQLNHFDPPAGLTAYLARFQCAITGIQGVVMLADRLWDNGGITISSGSLQAITSPSWPARDNNGTSSGDGVLIGVEVSATTGANTPSITVGYTNSAGTSGRTGTNLETTVASSQVGMLYRIGLQSGDAGVQSVQSITLGGTGWASGTINMVAYRILSILECNLVNFTFGVDAVTGGFPIIYNGAVPYIIVMPSSTTAGSVMGAYVETQG